MLRVKLLTPQEVIEKTLTFICGLSITVKTKSGESYGVDMLPEQRQETALEVNIPSIKSSDTTSTDHSELSQLWEERDVSQ